MRLAEVLQRKGTSNAITVDKHATVADAIRAMDQYRIGSVLIADSDQQLLGIFTERDVMHICADGKGGQLDTTPITDCMTSDVVTATPGDQIDDILSLMTTNRFRRIPILTDGKIAGVLSIGDLVKAKLDETAEEAAALRQYISS